MTKSQPSKPPNLKPFDIQIESASLCHGDVSVFDDLCLTLRGGQWVCLLGVSGVGKSSLLSLLLDNTPFVSCSDGKPLNGRIAWMAQSESLLPWKTVLNNVTLGNNLRGESPNFATARTLLHQVGLHHMDNRLPHQLSGGQRQRVALARTLLENTPVVLMDEPFSAVDAITRHGLQDIAHQVLQGRTVFMITHDPIEALRLADRILIMQWGGTLQDMPLPAKPTDTTGTPLPRSVGGTLIAQHHQTILTQLMAEGPQYSEQAKN